MSEASAQESLDSADGWARASELFLELADLDAAERQERLDAIDDPTLFEAVTALLGEDPGKEAAPEPRRFGPYIEVQRIGAGGMGEVFLSRRADGTFERDVAVKLLRPGLESAETNERFLRERQTLAALEHESIVRLLDGGTTDDDRPFLVMEYVDGLAIDDFCSENELDLRARLRLFCRVLEGVAHAHARGVIHRDLKPSNILVRHDGAPRIVDFGIARLADDGAQRSLTRTGARMFTPEFASPEQIAGEPVTAATDVFSLGVVLYRLVAGRSPWPEDGSTHKIERAVLHASPPPPSKVARAEGQRGIRGDLDTIVLHCLDSIPERRYPDAQVLADELERFLGGYTIRARPIGPVRRSARWVARRPWHTVAIVATLAAAVALTWTAIERRRDAEDRKREAAALAASQEAERLAAERVAELQTAEREAADREAERLAALREAMPGRLDAVQKLGNEGLILEARESLSTIEEDLLELVPAPELEVGTSIVQAKIALYSGNAQSALEYVERARDVLEHSEFDDDASRLELADLEANALGASRDYEGAVRVATAALKAVPLDAETSVRTQLVTTLARALLQMNRTPEAVELMERELETARATAEEHDVDLAVVLGLLGRGYGATGRAADAIPLLEESLETHRWHHGTRHANVAEILTFLGKAHLDLEQFDEALEALKTARDAYAVLDQPQSEAFAVDFLARAANAVGDYELELECLRANQTTIEESLPGSRPLWYVCEYRAAVALSALDRLEEARDSFEAALGGNEVGLHTLGVPAVVEARLGLAGLLERLDERDEARSEIELALELWEGQFGADHPRSKILRARLEQ